MSVSRSTILFKEVNENTSKCSAWLKEKDRYCGRNIIAADRKRKAFLLQSIDRSRTHGGSEAEELAGLYFCNGWHRPGGRYAISSSERRKLLQALFPRSSESRTQILQAIPRPDPPTSSPANETQESTLLHFSNRERLSFSIEQPAMQSSWHDASEFSEGDQFSFSTAQPTLHSTQHDASELSEAEMLFLSIAQLTVQSPQQDWSTFSEAERLSFSTAQPAPSQHDAFELSDAERLSFSIASPEVQSPEHDISTFSVLQRLRQSTSAQAQDLGTPLPASSDNQRATTASSSSVAQLQQNSQSESTQSGQPSLTSFAEGNRKDRPVDVGEECPICTDPLEDPSEVTRCTFCHKDIHLNCMLEWLTAPETSINCICCRYNLKDDDITALIGSVRDPIENEKFQRQYQLKTGRQEQSPSILLNRRDRPVDMGEECPICTRAFEDPNKVARCRFCHNDLHLNCLLTWLTTPDHIERCPSCRCDVEDDNVRALIEAVRDPIEKMGFEEQRERKRSLYQRSL